MKLPSIFRRPRITVQTYHKKAVNERDAIRQRTEQLRCECGLPVQDLPWRREAR